jgi:hypothetical protein
VNSLSKKQIAAALLLILAAAAVGLTNLVFTGFACAWDTSTCAKSNEKNGVYEGVMRAATGEPYGFSAFMVEFGSRGGDDLVPVLTDESGRYCIRWAEEDVAAVRSPGGAVISTSGGSFLGSWRDLNGSDPPPDCQESFEGIPWRAAEDAETTWQYWLLLVLPALAIVVLIAALIGQRTRYGRVLFVTGGLLVATACLAFLLL